MRTRCRKRYREWMILRFADPMVTSRTADSNSSMSGQLKKFIQLAHCLWTPVFLGLAPTNRDHGDVILLVHDRCVQSLEPPLRGVVAEIDNDLRFRRETRRHLNIEIDFRIGI